MICFAFKYLCKTYVIFVNKIITASDAAVSSVNLREDTMVYDFPPYV